MPTLTKLYSMEEASLHNTKDDCWIIVDGKVYDVTTYLDEHPGGDDVVLEATGKDATDDFKDAGHSKSARELMENYCIGELDTSSTIIPELEISSKNEATNNTRNTGPFLLRLLASLWRFDYYTCVKTSKAIKSSLVYPLLAAEREYTKF